MKYHYHLVCAVKLHRYLKLMQQHRSLLDAIIEGRPEDARTRAHEHLVFVEDGLLEVARAETRAQRALRRAQGTSSAPS